MSFLSSWLQEIRESVLTAEAPSGEKHHLEFWTPNATMQREILTHLQECVPTANDWHREPCEGTRKCKATGETRINRIYTLAATGVPATVLQGALSSLADHFRAEGLVVDELRSGGNTVRHFMDIYAPAPGDPFYQPANDDRRGWQPA